MSSKKPYTVEKKTHSYKALIITGANQRILYVSRLFAGSVHDYEILRRCFAVGKKWWADKRVVVDLGFLGIDKEYPIGKLVIPHKRKRVKEGQSNQLSQEQQLENKQIGRERIKVEHAIGRIKRCKFLGQIIRIKKVAMLDVMVGVAAGIANFKNS